MGHGAWACPGQNLPRLQTSFNGGLGAVWRPPWIRGLILLIQQVRGPRRVGGTALPDASRSSPSAACNPGGFAGGPACPCPGRADPRRIFVTRQPTIGFFLRPRPLAPGSFAAPRAVHHQAELRHPTEKQPDKGRHGRTGPDLDIIKRVAAKSKIAKNDPANNGQKSQGSKGQQDGEIDPQKGLAGKPLARGRCRIPGLIVATADFPVSKMASTSTPSSSSRANLRPGHRRSRPWVYEAPGPSRWETGRRHFPEEIRRGPTLGRVRSTRPTPKAT